MYYFYKVVFGFILSVIFRIKVTGRENIPAEGPILICSNHIAFVDPVLIICKMKRKVRFMAKKELFNHPIAGWFFRSVGTFPVDRGGADMKAYKTTMNYLKEGQAVGMFVQGTRVKEGETAAAKAGAALFAKKAGATVVPVGIVGNYRAFSKVTLHFGEPIEFPKSEEKKISSEELGTIANDIMEKINELCKQ